MSVVGKIVAPSLLLGFSVLGIYRQRGLLEQSRTPAFVKGSVSLAVCAVLHLVVVRRCALGGSPSSLHGSLALMYPAIVAASVALTYVLYSDIPPSVVLELLKGGSRLGASGNQPVYQYRLNDVVDRVREIVRDRVKQPSPDDDFRER